jgi:hypothetical protein
LYMAPMKSAATSTAGLPSFWSSALVFDAGTYRGVS